MGKEMRRVETGMPTRCYFMVLFMNMHALCRVKGHDSSRRDRMVTIGGGSSDARRYTRIAIGGSFCNDRSSVRTHILDWFGFLLHAFTFFLSSPSSIYFFVREVSTSSEMCVRVWGFRLECAQLCVLLVANRHIVRWRGK